MLTNPCIPFYLAQKECRLKFQVRSEEMDQVAQSGIAAHWMYKDASDEQNAPHTRTA